MIRLIACFAALCIYVSLSIAAEPNRPPEPFSVLGADLVAPATIHVNAVNVPLDRGTCLTARYIWDFGDPASKNNKLTGFCAAHTFDRAGAYTIALTLTTESGKTQRFERRITVRAGKGNLVHVSSAGNDRNNGLTPATAVWSIGRALSLAHNESRILLRRGDRFDVATTMKIAQRNLVIGAYGQSVNEPTGLRFPQAPTANPLLVYVGLRNNSPFIETQPQSRNVTVQDITFDSVFTRDAEKKNMPAGVRPTGTNLTVRRCTFLNVGDGVNNNARPSGVLMQDCVAPLATGLRSYLAWIEGTDQAYIGNIVANSTREAAMRISYTGADRVLIAYNDLTNVDRTSVDKIDIAKNALTVHYGSHVYIYGNTFRTGPVMVGPLGEGDGLRQKGDPLKWAVFENNRIVESGLRVNHGMQHLMVRNNRFWSNDRWAINVEGFNAEYKRGSSDLTLDRNTALNTGRKGYFLRVGGRVDGISVLNNLYVAPKLAPGGDMTAVVYVGQKDLHGFERVAGNVWPITRPQPYAAGGIFYVWPDWSDARGYLKLDRWNELTQGNDRQADIEVNGGLWPIEDIAAGARP